MAPIKVEVESSSSGGGLDWLEIGRWLDSLKLSFKQTNRSRALNAFVSLDQLPDTLRMALGSRTYAQLFASVRHIDGAEARDLSETVDEKALNGIVIPVSHELRLAIERTGPGEVWVRPHFASVVVDREDGSDRKGEAQAVIILAEVEPLIEALTLVKQIAKIVRTIRPEPIEPKD